MMPTNEQYIEAARRKLKPFQITIDAAENAYYVSFMNQTPDCRIRDPISVTQEEAEAVALEPKQEHDHDNCDTCCETAMRLSEHCSGEGCSICHDRYLGTREIGFEAGKASHEHATCEECERNYVENFNQGIEKGKASLSSHDHNTASCVLCEEMYYKRGLILKPFDVEALGILIAHTDTNELTSHEIAQEIADHFAAPERKPWACTQKQAEEIDQRFFSVSTEIQETTDPVDQLRITINEVLGLQPAPVEAEPACPGCGHTYLDGISVSDDKTAVYCGLNHCNCVNKFHKLEQYHRERGTV